MANSILDKIIASKEDQEKQDINPTDVVYRLLQLVSDKEADVIRRRFGLQGTAHETLESIGESFSVTRERVRQIQSGAIKKIRNSDAFTAIIRPAEHVVFTLLEHFGGIMSEDHLLDELFVGGRNQDEERAMVFLLEELLSTRFVKVKRSGSFRPAWKINTVQDQAVQEVVDMLVDVIKRIGKPVSFEDLLGAIADEPAYKQNADKLSDDVIFGYIQLSKKIAANPFDEYGLQKWGSISPKRMNDKIYLILKKIGKPMHFVDIAKQITEVFTKEAYPPTVHNELILNNQYVLVGRGIYALKEWGYKQGVVADVIEAVLEQANKPLSRAEIVERVSEQRIVKKNTIHLALTNKELFVRYPDGTYGLAEQANQSVTA